MDQRVRIMRVIARMNIGGPALQVAGLVESMDASRFDQRLLVGRVGPGEADYLELRAPTVSAQRVPGLGRSPDATGDLRALGVLVREMKSFQPHIVHTHTAKAGVLGRLAARRCRVPATVHTFHGHLLHGYFSPFVTRAVVQTERVLARRTTRLVAVGSAVRDDLLAAGIGRPDRFVVVPPGIALPPAPNRADARRILGLPARADVVTLAARLTAIKRPERFVEVAHELAATYPSAVFAICGEGPLLADLRQQAAGLGDRFRFLGWRADVEVVYAASDLVVLTSDNEGMPVSLIEAALVGRPAVATDVGSVREVVLDGRTGVLTSTDVPAIAKAVSDLLADSPRREELGRAAAVHAQASFSRARLVADTERLYDELVADLRPTR